MSNFIGIQVDDSGTIFVIERNSDGGAHRRPILIGGIVSGAYVETDVSGESAIVQSVAAEAWTAERKLAWQQNVEARYAEEAAQEAASAQIIPAEGDAPKPA